MASEEGGPSGPTGPLAGLRVLEVAGIGPAPYACLLLAELGADVVRVDRPGDSLAADPARVLRRGRRSLAVDLKRPEGRELLLRLCDRADVLVEGMRPGVMERLGVGPEECRERNPALVYARMTGWGQDGPLSRQAGHDINYVALTGALHATGAADKPRQAVNLVGDFGGGSLFLVVGILAALQERAVSGHGQVVDAAMVEGAASLMTMVYGMHADGFWSDRREANLLDGGAPFYDTYRCSDGGHVAVGALEPQFYAALLEGLGLVLDQGQYDVAAWPAHRAAIAERFASRTRAEWEAVFEGTDACVTPVLGLDDAPRHRHNVARGTFTDLGAGHQPRVAPRFSRTPAGGPGRLHEVGEDGASVLRDAGLAEDEIRALTTAGVVVADR